MSLVKLNAAFRKRKKIQEKYIMQKAGNKRRLGEKKRKSKKNKLDNNAKKEKRESKGNNEQKKKKKVERKIDDVKMAQEGKKTGDECTKGVYALRLNNGKIYVGKSKDVRQRLLDHRSGSGKAAAVRAGGGVQGGLLLLTPRPADGDIRHWEQKETLAQMKANGIDNVRGWIYAKPKPLSADEIRTIRRMIADQDDSCYNCGRVGHLSSNCFAKTKLPWVLDAERLERLQESTLPCYRCGRSSHHIEKCFARTHANGNTLQDLPRRSGSVGMSFLSETSDDSEFSSTNSEALSEEEFSSLERSDDSDEADWSSSEYSEDYSEDYSDEFDDCYDDFDDGYDDFDDY